MKIYDLDKIHGWFENYAAAFRVHGQLPQMSEMKRKHCYRVEALGKRLVGELGWDADSALVGVAAALLHDTGRFSQYRDYGTLYDAGSVDHGERGYQELLREFPHDLTDADARGAILEAVRRHNKKDLGDGVAPEFLPVCKLVRDADKLDVFKLVQEHIDDGKVGSLLPRHAIDAPLSDEVLDEVEAHGRSSYKNVKSLADFLFLQITWLLDINFAPSMRIIEEDGVVEKIISQIPMTEKAQKILDGLLQKISYGVIFDGDGGRV